MEFRKVGPTVLKNNLPSSYSRELIGNLRLEFDLTLPDSMNNSNVLYLNVKTKVFLRDKRKTPALFLFETQTEFFCPNNLAVEQRDIHCEFYILNAVSDFTSVFNKMIENSNLNVCIDHINLEGINQQIKSAMLTGRIH